MSEAMPPFPKKPLWIEPPKAEWMKRLDEMGQSPYITPIPPAPPARLEWSMTGANGNRIEISMSKRVTAWQWEQIVKMVTILFVEPDAKITKNLDDLRTDPLTPKGDLAK